ncbi:hypothetical protein ATDW_24260 [Asticcacaulis sp. DW145]|uniref:hypothetical protein n=1 Tax=unclassified Asticcacaulis TaxID=2628350 RepID=UPI0026230D82|nr:hypothetical protein [Asticcacaulis sp.]BEV11930.1 hypothetical protein ATDW_24260 [Asticcacaulis sp. DW145]
MFKPSKPVASQKAGLLTMGRASRVTQGEAPFPAPDAGQTQMRATPWPSAD